MRREGAWGRRRPQGTSATTQESIHKRGEETYHQISKAARDCWVQLRFLLEGGEYAVVRRQLAVSGEARYSINYREYPHKVYAQYLGSNGLLAEACNFAIWQNQTDILTSKEPNQLRQHFERLSGSIFLKEPYEECRSELERLNRTIEEDTLRVGRLRQERKNIKEVKLTAEEYARHEHKHAELMELQLLARLLFREMDLRDLQRQVARQQDHDRRAQQEANHRKAQLQREYREAAGLKATLAGLLEQAARLQAKLKSYNTQELALKAQQLRDLQKEHSDDAHREAQFRDRLEALQHSLPAVAESAQLQEYLQLYAQWEKENYLIKCDIEKKQANLASFDRLIQHKTDTLDKISRNKAKNESDEASRHSKIRELQAALAELKASITKSKSELARASESAKTSATRLE